MNASPIQAGRAALPLLASSALACVSLPSWYGSSPTGLVQAIRSVRRTHSSSDSPSGLDQAFRSGALHFAGGRSVSARCRGHLQTGGFILSSVSVGCATVSLAGAALDGHAPAGRLRFRRCESSAPAAESISGYSPPTANTTCRSNAFRTSRPLQISSPEWLHTSASNDNTLNAS